MKCEICGAQYRQIGTDLVCLNGHALQNTLEVVDDEFGAFKGRRRRIRQLKESKINKGEFHSSIERLMLAKLIFADATKFFNISSDRIYRYFTSFFHLSKQADVSNEMKIESDFVFSTQTVLAIIYISKRSEMEAKGVPYFFSKFREGMLKFKFNSRVKPYSKEYKMSTRGRVGMIIPNTQISVVSILNQVRNIADFDVFIKKRIERSEVHTSGVLSLNVENARSNIRRLFSRDPNLLLQYFEKICKDLGVEITEELLLYFHKYIYTFDYRRLFVPEFSFVMFIANYFSERCSFSNTDLERRILQFLKITKFRLLSAMNENARRLSNYCSPEMLIQSREMDNALRFANLRRAMWLIDMFKNNSEPDEK